MGCKGSAVSFEAQSLSNSITLYENLHQVRREEDVTDAYVKALGLKGYSKNFIDIQNKEVWFGAKSVELSDKLRWAWSQKTSPCCWEGGDFLPHDP